MIEMKISVFNGSPNGQNSATNVIVSAFLKGAETEGDYFTFRKTSIRNKENGNPHQGTHQFATRNASIRARNALADGDITE